MPGKLPTLHELCLQRTAHLLKTSYWDPELPLSHNPFASLPSIVVDTLIIHVTRISTSEPLLSSDLRLLLTSGRVREFILDEDDPINYLNVTDLSLQKILMDLSSSCRYLIAVKIRSAVLEDRNARIVTAALNCLLNKAQNVKHVESCIEFDLRVLCHSFQLENLVLHFPLISRIYDFLEVDGQLKSNVSLKCLQVYEDREHPISHLDVAIILKYCTELVSLNHDISESLEHLHAEELHNGCLTHKYKIQRCFLGCCYDHINDTSIASRDGVLIAALTCPYLQVISLNANDDLISPLSHFRNLSVLIIDWEPFPDGDFSSSVQSVFEKPEVVHDLKSLELAGFTNVDFSLIGVCCPNLERLLVLYIEEILHSEYSPTSFRKLQTLQLLKCWNNCKKDTLVGILSNATDLKELVIRSAGELTDDVLEHVLKKNTLSELKNLYIYQAGLSVCGWQNLACSLPALEYLDVYEPDSGLENCEAAILKINPRITVNWNTI